MFPILSKMLELEEFDGNELSLRCLECNCEFLSEEIDNCPVCGSERIEEL